VLDCAPPPPPLPTVVTTCVDDSTAVTGGSEAATETADGAGGSRQTELDHILDEIVRDIDLLDQTLADNCGQSHAVGLLICRKAGSHSHANTLFTLFFAQTISSCYSHGSDRSHAATAYIDQLYSPDGANLLPRLTHVYTVAQVTLNEMGSRSVSLATLSGVFHMGSKHKGGCSCKGGYRGCEVAMRPFGKLLWTLDAGSTLHQTLNELPHF